MDVNLFAQVEYSRMRQLHFAFQTQKSQHASRVLVKHFHRKFIYFNFNDIIQSIKSCQRSYQTFRLSQNFFFFLNRSRIQSTITKIIYNLLHHIIMTTVTKEKERREKKKGNYVPMLSHVTFMYILHVLLSILSLLTNFLSHLREERIQFTSTHKYRYNTRHATRKNDQSRIKIIAPRTPYSLSHLVISECIKLQQS